MQIKVQELNIAFILGMLLGNTSAAVLQTPMTESGINIYYRVKLQESIETEILNVLEKRREGLPVTTRWKIYNYATSYADELGQSITESIFKPVFQNLKVKDFLALETRRFISSQDLNKIFFQEEMSDHIDITLSPSLQPSGNVNLQRSEGLLQTQVNGHSLNTVTHLNQNQKSTQIPRPVDRHVSNLLNSLMGGFGK
ncbi:hypothetical protein ACJMK2_019550 [Sinanodonta woodiana]|uniref:Uncharacterized protein n=1 Tax=Sinanodonta woodiana TaxID=1069815 RepID=A0ABD3TZJ5_SINWO